MTEKKDVGSEKIDSFNSRLRQAVKSGDIEALRTLFAVKNYVNVKDAKGKTALNHVAISPDHTEIAASLLEAGADCLLRDGEGKDAREYASEGKNSEAAELMCRSLGMTPLHRAAENGDLVAIATLLTKGADIESRDNTGLTPLSYAVLAKETEAVKFLLQKGANINNDNAYGVSALHAAVVEGEIEILNALLDYSDVDLKGYLGVTPLMAAVQKNNVDAVKLLLERGANVNACNDHGYSLLHMAEDTEIAAVLLEASAKINTRNVFGQTPLHFAAIHCNAEMVIFLLEKYESENVEDELPDDSDDPPLFDQSAGVIGNKNYENIKAIIDDPNCRRWCCVVTAKPVAGKPSKFFRPYHTEAVLFCVGYAADKDSFTELVKRFMLGYNVHYQIGECHESPVGSLREEVELTCIEHEIAALEAYQAKQVSSPAVYLYVPAILRFGRKAESA